MHKNTVVFFQFHKQRLQRKYHYMMMTDANILKYDQYWLMLMPIYCASLVQSKCTWLLHTSGFNKELYGNLYPDIIIL